MLLASCRMAERKRQCKREDDSDTDVASRDSAKAMWYDDYFLAEVLRELMDRCGINIQDFYNNEKCIGKIVNLVHHGILNVGPPLETAARSLQAAEQIGALERTDGEDV
jgi:hypothetical protein